MEAAGIEPASASPLSGKGLRHSEDFGAAKCAATGAHSAPICPILGVVVNAWPHLDDADRKAILSIVQRASTRKQTGPGEKRKDR